MNWNKEQVLKELALKDSLHFHETQIYRMSNCEDLGYFKTLILLSSPEDNYAPFCSSRVQLDFDSSHSEYLPL
jgi:hypothetical protein